MLAKIKVKLSLPTDMAVSPSFGSLLHGVLMRGLSSEKATLLHRQGMKPFSQYLLGVSKGEAIWVINILHETAEELWQFLEQYESQEIYLEQKKSAVKILERRIEQYPDYQEMAAQHYLGPFSARRWRLRFLTPTAFKSSGRYHIVPTVRLIYQNLLNRWNQFAWGVSLAGEDICEQLAGHTEITAYHLRSQTFHLEGTRIPAFGGWLDLTVHGPEALARIAVLLFHYAELSGVGIKTALGMGGVELETCSVCAGGRHRPSSQ